VGGARGQGEEHTLSQSLSRKETWLLFFASVVGMGSATTLLNNLGEIVDAMGGEDDVGTYVSIQGVFMAAGRYGSGWMSEVLLQKYGINRVTSLMFGYFSIGISAVSTRLTQTPTYCFTPSPPVPSFGPSPGSTVGFPVFPLVSTNPFAESRNLHQITLLLCFVHKLALV
jgi:hypothetical protein